MLCQKCKTRAATVHITNNINGIKTELALCHECAQNEHAISFIPSQDLFSDFFSERIFGNTLLREEKKCPVCNSTKRDLASSGRAGCPKCYEIFEKELSQIIYGIHGNAVHCGAAPEKQHENREKELKLSEMKKELQDAVAAQDYEKAAQLRDSIRELEKGEDN